MVTGGAGGLGGATSQLLLNHGWQVFVADYSQQALQAWHGKAGVTPLQRDVTDTASVAQAAQQVREAGVQLDAIINFAGLMAVGSLVEMPPETIARILQVNVMGTVQVNQAFFPLLRRTGQRATSGRFINISSETGWETTAPFNGPYSMSKYAIESYSDALRSELQLVGVAAIKIQPGPFKTEMTGSISRVFEQAIAQSPTFGGYIARLAKMGASAEHKAHPPQVLAQAVYNALVSRRPRAAYSVRADFFRALLSYLPTRWVDAILYKVCKG